MTSIQIEDEFLKVAIDAASIGGEICRRYFRKENRIDTKEVSNLVTRADVESENAIVDCLRTRFPDHSILAEENQKAAVDSDRLWVVDPLDGTNNFAHGLPHFSVSIAFWQDGKPHCGVVHNPVRNEFYYAKAGDGAYGMNGPLRVSNENSLDKCLIGCGFYYNRGRMMRATLNAVENCFERNIHGIRRFGTASLDLVHVASGHYGGFFEYQLAPWDFAAGRLLVEEAGGQVTTCRGKRLGLDQSTVLATNSLIHQELLEIVQTHHP